jgi:hypothetical protein
MLYEVDFCARPRWKKFIICRKSKENWWQLRGGIRWTINAIKHKRISHPKCLKSTLSLVCSREWKIKMAHFFVTINKWHFRVGPRSNLDSQTNLFTLDSWQGWEGENKALRKLNGTLLMPRNSAESHSHCSFAVVVAFQSTRDEI